MESMYFIFDGIKSSDMGLYIMRIGETGFVQTPYWGGADIHESKNRKKVTPYFYGVTRNNLEFPPLQLVLCDKNMQPRKWTSDDRYRIAKWLCHDTYKEFISSDDLGKRYYVLAEAQTDLHLINTQGYMEVKFRCNSSYGFSPIYIDQFDLSNNIETATIELENKSNVVNYYRPIIEFELVDNCTDIQFKNLSNGGKTMRFEGLNPNEIVSIDCENEIIKSNMPNSNPFSKFNVDEKKYWLDLVYGVNQIEVTSKCKLWVRMQYPIAQ